MKPRNHKHGDRRAEPGGYSRTENVRRAVKRLFVSRPALLLVLIVALGLIMAVTKYDLFFTTANAKSVLLNVSVQGLLVVGMMILMIGGQFDLSIGSTLALSGVVAGVLIAEQGLPVAAGVVGAVLVGTLAGLINGLIVTRLGINALITTLATLSIYRGVTQLISGTGVGFIGEGYARIGQSMWFGLQSPFWIMIVVVVAAGFAMSRTRYFRQFYFVGGNERAAKLSGIRTNRVVFNGFVIMGTLAGVAGMMNAARLNAAVVSAGIGIELAIITAAVLGGASLAGGEGSILGGFLGVIFIGLVQNALIILRVNVFWQNIVIGLVLLTTLALEAYGKRAGKPPDPGRDKAADQPGASEGDVDRAPYPPGIDLERNRTNNEPEEVS